MNPLLSTVIAILILLFIAAGLLAILTCLGSARLRREKERASRTAEDQSSNDKEDAA